MERRLEVDKLDTSKGTDMDFQVHETEEQPTPKKPPKLKDYGEVFTTNEAGRYLKIQGDTLKKWRKQGKGPRYLQIEGAIRYRRVDLDSYLDAVTIDPAAQNEEE